MKFGFISLDFRRFSLEYCFRMAERYGMDGVEVWGGRPHGYYRDMDEEYIRQIAQWKKKYHQEIPMYTPDMLNSPYNLCSIHEKTRQDTIDMLKLAIKAAAQMECPRMLVTADHPGYEADRAQAVRCFVENMKELAREAGKQGVTLVLEPLTPMESPVITTADDCVNMLRAIGADNVEAMMDIVPPTVMYEPISAYFEKLKDRMNYIHICNTDGRTDAHVRLEGGILPIKDVLEVFRRHEYEGWVTCELYSEHFSDPELFLANTARLLKTYA